MSATSIGAFQRRQHLLSLAESEDVKPITRPPESEIVERAEHVFQECKQYRDEDLKMSDRWRSNRSWYLAGGRSSSRKTYVNLPYEKCEKLYADLTEADPEMNFRPMTPAGAKLAELLNLAAPTVWDENRGDRTYRQTVKAGIVFGTWLWKIEHDPGYGGRGPKVRFRQVPCYRGFPAPYATDMESTPLFVEVQPRTVEEIENDYGIRVEPEVKPEDFPDISEDLRSPSPGVSWETNLGGSNLVPMFPSSFLLGRDKTQGFVFQKEMWIRDPEVEAKYWIERTEKGPRAGHGMDLAYPRGRVISWANGRLLDDRENPYLDGRFPYVRFADVTFPQFFWGLGEIPNLVNLQLLHDDTVDTMRLIHAYMGSPRTVIDKTTGLIDGELGNDPGEIWWTNRGTQDRIKVHPGASPPAELYTHLARIEGWCDLMTGSFDVSRGENPPGVRAARAVVALQRAAGIRVRARLRDLEDTLKTAGMMIASRIQQFAPSMMQLQNRSGEFGDYFLSEDERFMESELEVDIVSNLDDLKALEFQKLLLLFQMRGVSLERLIKDSGLSSAQTLLAELPQLQAQQAMMAQMLAQAQGGTPTHSGDVGQAAQNVVGTQRAINRSMRSQME